ncbi:hypothetical protein GGR55DRAFT_27203 [Xylaria sp. FL0064]|nr:hypothetical protein GGR55DRAFT_27203 [Xylaria sp. FL0064]
MWPSICYLFIPSHLHLAHACIACFPTMIIAEGELRPLEYHEKPSIAPGSTVNDSIGHPPYSSTALLHKIPERVPTKCQRLLQPV